MQRIVMATAVLIALVSLIAFAARRNRGEATVLPVAAKPLLSRAEQSLYSRLVQTFPGHVVLAQVALSQFLVVTQMAANSARQSVFNRFRHLVADFVICGPDFTAIAVIELDDRSHSRPVQRERDQRKDEFLRAAGIKVVRISVAQQPGDAELTQLVGVSAVRTSHFAANLS
jgi:very-short-patch-repair endonuclease